jgi:phosphoribosylamine--glycine ligase
LKTLVIGSGGREHAIAWRLKKEGAEVHAAPGNPGIASIGVCHPVDGTPDSFVSLAAALCADLTIVGPEAPLMAGVVDAFQTRSLPVFGPMRSAALLEGSKIFAKRLMLEAAIPTARSVAASDFREALKVLREFPLPVVIKADGLAAGKGVIIANDEGEARQAVETLTAQFGPRLLIEEYVDGEEASFIVISDGKRALPLEASQDHKRVYDEDRGPNTGGMGAYCDGRILSRKETSQIMELVIEPAIGYMRRKGTPFQGFLYAGLMMTAGGPKVLEFNVRLGDPETQCLLHRIEGGFADALRAAAAGDLKGARIDWLAEPSVCVVMATSGYPEKPRTGAVIEGIENAESLGAVVFQAGTKTGRHGLETAGGRVLGVTASGADLGQAIRNAYQSVSQIRFEGMQYRKDIGRKGLKRW